MVEDFDWAIETPVPSLHEGAKFIINEDSSGCDGYNSFKPNEHIIFVIDSFGIGCMSNENGDNLGKDVANFDIIENTQEHVGQYKVGYYGEVQVEKAQELVDSGWWIPYEEI